ncbi:uncharacterized protein LOC112395980 isoform X2 [Neophocaena asiaeorientalis asiaeorientalis]|nr:uncharacterized protein LOC112395980 isoform X2 [Neophocaena asiaeorientalis asiaeorientalis]
MRQAGATLSKAEPSWDGVSSWAAAPSREHRLGSDEPPLGHQVSTPNPLGLLGLECTGCPKRDPGPQVDSTVKSITKHTTKKPKLLFSLGPDVINPIFYFLPPKRQICLSFPVPVPLLPHSSLAAQPMLFPAIPNPCSPSTPPQTPAALGGEPSVTDPAGIIKTPGRAYKETRRSTTWVLLTGQPILKQRLPRHIQPRANTHGSAANVNNGLKKLQQTLVVFGAQVKSQ